jgi:hypothetical protein
VVEPFATEAMLFISYDVCIWKRCGEIKDYRLRLPSVIFLLGNTS